MKRKKEYPMNGLSPYAQQRILWGMRHTDPDTRRELRSNKREETKALLP